VSLDTDGDKQLVERVQRGDKRAFDVLVLKYQNRIANLVGRYVRDSDEAFDVAQDTFLKAYRALPNFRGESAFYTWLYRIATNTAKNYLATKKRRPPSDDLDSEVAEQLDIGGRLKDMDTPEHLLREREIAITIQNAVQALPAELAAAITLREIDGLSYEEIAEAMDCPIGTVRSRIFRARDAIDQSLKPLLQPD
jgi:RNA polymerase sigma-70 factor (ECF subfamily)